MLNKVAKLGLSINSDDLALYVKHADWTELVSMLEILAERVYEHRKAHNGYVPLPIFEPLLGMGGVSGSVQIVNEVIDDAGNRIGFALKKRDATEAGWANLYHNTCCTMRMTDRSGDGLTRDTKETFGEAREEKLEFLGNVVNHEVERRSTCVTVMWRRRVTVADVGQFFGEWHIFSDAEIRARDPRIVNYNWDQLAYAMDEQRSPFAFFDTEAGVREGFV